MRTPSSSSIKGMTPLKFLGLALLLAGCAGLLLTPEQKQAALDAQMFADRIAEVYKVPKVRVVMESSMWPGAAKLRFDGVLFVGLNTPAWLQDVVVAHEMAHWINRDLEREEQIWREVGYNQNAFFERAKVVELETEVKVVEILQRVEGLSEREAFTLVHRSVQHALRLYQKKPVQLPRHPLPCELNAFLLQRFPAYAEWAKLCY